MSQINRNNGEKKELTEVQKTFMESQNQCALCKSPLEIRVESYLEDYNLKEEAECPSCKIRTRVKNHKMQ